MRLNLLRAAIVGDVYITSGFPFVDRSSVRFAYAALSKR